MKFSSAIIPLTAMFVTSVLSAPMKITRRAIDPALVPDFGHAAGVNPTGTGDCDGAVIGANGQPIKVPCACPPDRASFIQSLQANVDAGHAVNNPSVAVTFPTDDSTASQLARLTASTITLQNLNGPGQGCPASSTTFGAQAKAIQSGQAPPAPAAAPNAAAAPNPAAAPAPAAAPSPAAADSGSSVAALAPNLGFTSGLNPTGTGDCDGAVNGPDGKPIKVPCSCPPSQADFVQALEANVAAGHAINNPSVPFSFPTDSSEASQAARVRAALVTIQNLDGPGKGCPASSTTLSSQLAALQ
jgi:hypothetical protein